MDKAIVIAACAGAALALCGMGAFELPVNDAAQCRALAFTTDGNEYVAGIGSTPAGALQGAVWPAEMTGYLMDCGERR